MSINPRALSSILLIGVLLSSSTVSAQDAGDEAAREDGSSGLPSWVEADPFSEADDDPLGIDRGDRLERVEPTTVEEEAHGPVPVDHGEVLSAIAGVREVRHDVEVRLADGLARVSVTMRFTSSARLAAEVRYRLAVPDGSSLAHLEVCNERGCRDGRVDGSRGPLGPYDDAVRSHAEVDRPRPVAHAAPVEDERGAAIWLRAAPVPRARRATRRGEDDEAPGIPDGALEVRVSYVVAAPVRGGAARLTLPTRGRDDRVVAASIRVRSDELRGGAVDGVDAVERAVERAAWEPAEISARLSRAAPATSASAWRVSCGDGRCARLRVVAAPRPVRPREVVVLLDASPSTAGPTRGRQPAAVAALLSALPSRSRVRVALFAARAEAVVAEPTAPTDVSLVRVSRSLERELGSATRFEAAWELVAPWVREAEDPLLLLVGDGGLTTGEGATRAFRAARRAGAEVASLDLADRATTAGLRRALAAADGLAVDAGEAADRAGRGHGMEPLRERLAAILAPVVEPRVRARIGRRVVELGALR
ncbi:MAG TPA: VWA domain-containing protein, partial [Sandaracinaceae bacterium LLY-WYZ-13_1]|nr:VWA domain-containing protein [Sandaracinaceae bacterium LLY-WYZ-13_1]